MIPTQNFMISDLINVQKIYLRFIHHLDLLIFFFFNYSSLFTSLHRGDRITASASMYVFLSLFATVPLIVKKFIFSSYKKRNLYKIQIAQILLSYYIKTKSLDLISCMGNMVFLPRKYFLSDLILSNLSVVDFFLMRTLIQLIKDIFC